MLDTSAWFQDHEWEGHVGQDSHREDSDADEPVGLNKRPMALG